MTAKVGKPLRSSDFGKRLTRARIERGAALGRDLTKTAVAEEVGVTGTSVGRWESGEKEPDLATIERLAVYLGVTPGWLAFGEGPQAVGVPKPSETPIHTRVPIERFGPKYEPKEEAPRKRRPKAG